MGKLFANLRKTSQVTPNWDDLRIFLAIRRAGSLTAAAKRLAVTPSTVYRRLDALEDALQVRLIERGGRGLVLTPAGEELLRGVEKMDGAAEASINTLAGRDLEPAGTVRITAPDDLTDYLLLPILRDFQRQHPRIVVELIADNRFLNLTRREADVALRPTRQPPETLLGRRIVGLASTIYQAREQPEAPLETLDWIAWEEGIGPPVYSRWLAGNIQNERIKLRLNSMRSQAEAAAQGCGAALLPCRIGDCDPRLKRVMPPPPDWMNELWLLTHPGLRSIARIRLVTDELFRAIRKQKALFEGEAAALS
jgi:molybdate transport repressor ModE-like protein